MAPSFQSILSDKPVQNTPLNQKMKTTYLDFLPLSIIQARRIDLLYQWAKYVKGLWDGSAKVDFVVCVDALVGAGDVIELPAVRLPALVLEHMVVSIEVFGGFRPVLHVASSADTRAGVQRRAAEVRLWIFAASSPRPTGTADQIFLHGVVGDWAEDGWVLAHLICVVDGCADAHAVGPIRFFEGKFGGTDCLVEGAGRRAAVEFAEVGVVDLDVGACDGAEPHVEVVAVDIAEVVEVGSAGVGEGEFDQRGGGLSGDASAFDAEVVERGSAISGSAYEFAVFPGAASSRPEANGNGIGTDLLDLLRVWSHFPPGPGHKGHSEPSDPNGLITIILKPKGTHSLICYCRLQAQHHKYSQPLYLGHYDYSRLLSDRPVKQLVRYVQHPRIHQVLLAQGQRGEPLYTYLRHPAHRYRQAAGQTATRSP